RSPVPAHLPQQSDRTQRSQRDDTEYPPRRETTTRHVPTSRSCATASFHSRLRAQTPSPSLMFHRARASLGFLPAKPKGNKYSEARRRRSGLRSQSPNPSEPLGDNGVVANPAALTHVHLVQTS